MEKSNKIKPPYGVVFQKGDIKVYRHPEQIQLKVGNNVASLIDVGDIQALSKALEIVSPFAQWRQNMVLNKTKQEELDADYNLLIRQQEEDRCRDEEEQYEEEQRLLDEEEDRRFGDA